MLEVIFITGIKWKLFIDDLNTTFFQKTAESLQSKSIRNVILSVSIIRM